ncbi:hypothetical protein [Snuella sedimenti]|nr:hypothetical protein [Snuella sedimenti]
MYFLFCACLLVVSCQPKPDNSSKEAFEKNSKTVLANLEAWQNESLDYSQYAEDFVMKETGFGAPKDSLSLQEMKESDKALWKNYDFKMLTNPPVLLPGVNADTKEPDGSVRHYSEWEVTLPATDSTEAKSGVIKLYESFDFNEEGKIVYQQIYGDFTGLMMHLHSNDAMEDDMMEE